MTLSLYHYHLHLQNVHGGAVSRLLVKRKFIEIVGYKPTNNLTAHNAIAAVYKPL